MTKFERKEFKRKFERMLELEISQMPKIERGKFLREVENYLLNLCPKHPNHSDRYKCADCREKCKYNGVMGK